MPLFQQNLQLIVTAVVTQYIDTHYYAFRGAKSQNCTFFLNCANQPAFASTPSQLHSYRVNDAPYSVTSPWSSISMEFSSQNISRKQFSQSRNSINLLRIIIRALISHEWCQSLKNEKLCAAKICCQTSSLLGEQLLI